MIKEVSGILLPLFAEQILHIGGKSANHLHAQITAVFLYITVSGHVIEKTAIQNKKYNTTTKVVAIRAASIF
ncbi:hypothetical protein [Fournierella sp.]|uniref:hypothetical protein n=1 Tax=Allofournierella sp. TaxID=1940256 RepID=UPI0025C1E9B1|nr:hypothetical protein [Fournierella sp.]